MHEVAIASSVACVLFILTTCGFPKVGNWREVQNDRSSCIESATQCIQRGSSMFFLAKLHVDVTDHVVCKIVTHVEIFNLPILA